MNIFAKMSNAGFKMTLLSPMAFQLNSFQDALCKNVVYLA
jgi:hypothetical protein